MLLTHFKTGFIYFLVHLSPLTLATATNITVNLPTETMCALSCYNDNNCSRYAFKDFDAFLSDGNDVTLTGNCLLFNSVDIYPGSQSLPLPQGYKQKYLIVTSNSNQTTEILGVLRIEDDPLGAGFTEWITVGNSKIYFKEIIAEHTYDQAMLECLRHGAILPMESTDDFVYQMSLLSGDSTTPRFISLATERSKVQDEMHLVWTLGQQEWKENDPLSKCPKCQNWVFNGSADNQWVKIDPISKLYQTVVLGETTSKYYCQYLGENLATHKPVKASSIYNNAHMPEAIVDGMAHSGARFWHSNKFPGGDWLSIDIGSIYWITNVLFLGRLDKLSERNRNYEVWIGGPEPIDGAMFDSKDRNLCGIFPFRHRDDQLSGIACQHPVQGQIVVTHAENSGSLLNFMEVAIYGFKVV